MAFEEGRCQCEVLRAGLGVGSGGHPPNGGGGGGLVPGRPAM